MKPAPSASSHSLRTFVTGALAALPLAATVFVFWWAVSLLWRWLGPGSAVASVLSGIGLGMSGSEFVGYLLGLGIVALAILLLGVFIERAIGRSVARLVDQLLRRIPLVRTVWDLAQRMVGLLLQQNPQAHFAWPRGPLLVIGLLILAGMTAEGAMYDWCVLYLQQELGQPQSQAALGYAVFSASMAASRFAGDALRARYDERTLLRCGAGLAAGAMAVVLLSAHPVVAWVGFALVGAGLAPVAPILFSAATRVPGVSPAAAIASVTSVGYSGFMLWPPLIGALATASSLTWALGVVVVAAALLALGAGRVQVR